MTTSLTFVRAQEHGRVPLEGLAVTSGRGTLATAVAARHLRALGCRTDPDGVAAEANGVRIAGRRSAVECTIGWAGPVAARLDDELCVQAACGIMEIHGRDARVPAPMAIDYASIVAGLLGVHGLLAGMIARVRGIDIRRVETSVAQAALLSVAQYLAVATSGDDWVAPRAGPARLPFISAEGVRFELETLEPAGWQRFWTRLDVDPAAIRAGWAPFEYRFATATCHLPTALAEAAGTRPFHELTQIAAEADVSLMAINDMPFPARGAPWRVTPVPTSGTGRAAEPLAAGSGALPLAELVVVDAGRRIQGPLAGHVLGLLGARVVHIEPPGGDPMRWMPPLAGGCSARFLALNRGKEVVEVDLRSSAGRQAVKDLALQADVFLHNWAPGKAAELGLDASDLATVRPGLVYASASGWGEALGPRPPVGTDFMVQAHSGLAAMVRPPGEAPAPSMATIVDILGGLVCAEGVLAALLIRLQGGESQRVDTSLLSAAQVVQPRRAHWGSSSWTPLHKPLQTADGYLALSRRTADDTERVAAACGLRRMNGSSPADAVVARLRAEPTVVWVRRLRAAGLVAVPVCTDLAALAADPAFSAALHHDVCTWPRAAWSFPS